MGLICPHCQSRGIFKRLLTTTTAIEVDAESGILPDAEAVEVPGSTYVSGHICCGCGKEF